MVSGSSWEVTCVASPSSYHTNRINLPNLATAFSLHQVAVSMTTILFYYSYLLNSVQQTNYQRRLITVKLC